MAVLSYVREQMRVISTTLDGENLPVVLGELVTRLFGAIIENVKHFVVSPDGAVRLLRFVPARCSLLNSDVHVYA
jgi:hypothetical protein